MGEQVAVCQPVEGAKGRGAAELVVGEPAAWHALTAAEPPCDGEAVRGKDSCLRPVRAPPRSLRIVKPRTGASSTSPSVASITLR